MRIGVNGQKDIVAGLAFTMVGGAFFFASRSYEMGTALTMGPGYFPALCGITLGLLGLAAIVKGLRAEVPDPLPSYAVEPLLLILLSIVSFGLLIDRAGLVVATFVCLFFACFRRVFSHPIEILLIFVGLTAFNVIVFIHGFGMTIPLFWGSK